MRLRQQKLSFLSQRLISLEKALYWNLLPECRKRCSFRCNFAKFSRGHTSRSAGLVVPSALPLKLLCDVTQMWWNFAPPSEIFCVRQCPNSLISNIQKHLLYTIKHKNYEEQDLTAAGQSQSYVIRNSVMLHVNNRFLMSAISELPQIVCRAISP